VFAGVFALTLGVGLVFLLEALNTRVLGAAEVERQLNLPLLARIPAPPKAVRKMNSLIMQVDPDSPAAEAFRVLRTNLSFHNISIGARTIMVTSAVGGEGKSTTIANLGIALARAGQRVALVELDLRQPVLAGYFGFDRLLGVTDVASGKAQLGSVFVDGGARGETAESGSGSLGLLTAGTSPTVAGEFMASIELRQMLDSLRDQADIVLIDAPPLLLVGDALQLASHVDGIVVVTRLGRVTRQMLNDLRRALRSCDAAKIGFVATGAEREAHYGSGYGYGDGYGYGQQHDRQPDLWSKDS
jgi:capsular exopolysaccharide synthesis family protein